MDGEDVRIGIWSGNYCRNLASYSTGTSSKYQYQRSQAPRKFIDVALLALLVLDGNGRYWMVPVDSEWC